MSSAVAVTNISESFTYKKMAAKINWHRCGTIIKSLSPYVFSFVYVLILLNFFPWYCVTLHVSHAKIQLQKVWQAYIIAFGHFTGSVGPSRLQKSRDLFFR